MNAAPLVLNPFERLELPLGELSCCENLPEHLQELLRRYVSGRGGDSFALPRIDPERFAMLLHDTRRILFEGGVSRPKTPQEFVVARQMLEFLENNLEFLARVYPGKAQRIRDLLLGLEQSRLGKDLQLPPPRLQH